MLSGIIKIGAKLLPWVIYIHGRPFRRELNREVKTVLDIGCGQGLVGMQITRPGRLFSVGADIFEPDLKIARERNAHNDYILCDARSLPIKEKSFDAVLCLELLEHLEKAEGKKLIKSLEAVAAKKVIITTPVGFLHTDPESNRSGQDNPNPYQDHLGGWQPDELKDLGYRVYYNDYLHRLEKFFTNRHSTWAWMLSTVIFTMLAPLNWLSPSLGVHLFCVKVIETP
jgi:ubiquinone/menaquinone biosynthesis C-methylase UbiE